MIISLGDLGSIDKWWQAWLQFVFEKEISIKKNGELKKVSIYELFGTIKNAKYPAITLEEEAMSIPLQTLCLAIFDASLVYMMNTLSPDNWQRIKGGCFYIFLPLFLNIFFNTR